MNAHVQHPIGLTPKQARFVSEYLLNSNATQAAIRAGYSPKTAKSIGHENLTKPDIAAAIKQEEGQTRERLQIDRDWVLLKLQEVVEEDNTRDRVPALTLMARILGLMVDKREYSGSIGHSHTYELLLEKSPEELTAIIEATRPVVVEGPLLSC